MGLKIICVEFENLKQFKDGKFCVDFVATDRVLKNSEMFRISGNVATQNVIGFVGLNATGKTTALRLLKTALDIVILNKDLNDAITSSLIVDDTIIRTTFFYNNIYYQLESIVGCRDDDTGEKVQKFYYKKETLRLKKSAKIYTRAKLTDFRDAKDIEVTHRSSIEKDAARYLDESKSIISPIIRDISSYVSGNLWVSFVNAAVLSGKTPPEILEVFDESIEEFYVATSLSKDEPIEWRLKFKNDSLVYRGIDMLAPNLLISTGTISGQRLVLDAIKTLKKGGYLFVDELEAHLNKELVRVVLSLFSSRETNPKGACLIFSTHYVEILDFSILNRKDNIYITRKINYLLSVRKFSNDFKRNDFKKSEIILSNSLNGTAPKYEAIERLRGYVCKQVN